MKALVLFLCLVAFSPILAQDFWIQRESMQLARIGATGFSINNMGYVGMGRNASQQYLKDMWMYNPATDTWTQKITYPGGGSYSLSVAVVGSYVYLGLGYNGSATQSDWWRYDPVTDTYLQLASSPGLPRYGASAFTIGNKIYLIAGSKGGVPYYKDCFVYDVTTNMWAQISDFPAGLRNHSSAFSYNGKGYVTCGTVDLTLSAKDMWEYNPQTNTWTQKSSLPGQIRTAASSFQINHLMFVCTGLDIQTIFLADLWEYNVLTDTWTARTAFPGPARYFGVGFTVGNHGYVATGGNYNSTYSDIYQYTPATVAIEKAVGSNQGVYVFPNPSSGVVGLEVDNLENFNTIEVFSSEGALLKKEYIQGIDLTDFKVSDHPGLYVLKLNSTTHNSAVIRVVIQ